MGYVGYDVVTYVQLLSFFLPQNTETLPRDHDSVRK